MNAAMISGMQSVISNAIIGKNSLFAIRGHTATTPVFIDPTVFIFQTNGVINPTISQTRGGSSELVFALPKNSTLVGPCFLETVLTQGTLAAPPALAEYQKNVGDRLCELVTLQYGNTQIQRYNSDFQVFFRRLCKNDVNIEATNVNVLGNLPPSTSATGTEAVLASAFTNPAGVTLTTPLEELVWVNRKDESWMPESLALEGQLRIQLAAWPDLIITSTRDATAVAAFPTVTTCRLRYFEYTLSAAEKENRLKIYKTPQGMIQKFLDLELQTGFVVQGSGARAAYANTVVDPLAAQADLIVGPIQLNNLRLDMAELVFCVRRLTNAAPADYPLEAGVIGAGYSGSQYESNPSLSLVWAAQVNTAGPVGRSIQTEVQIRSFSFAANGKTIFTSQPDLYNRSFVRKYFHPDAQVADPVYCIPLSFFPEDRTNATGHLSASVLGNLTLTIVLANPGANISYQVDVYSHSHNILQSRAGGITKALF